MRAFPWRWLPAFELVKFKKVEFFPSGPLTEQDLASATSICIGAKTRTIGDALMLSSLPRQLSARYPHLKIFTYPRAFNPIVFLNNPFVRSARFLPPAVYGDDCNWGEGHLIELKEQFFGLPRSIDPKPEIFLSPQERVWGEQFWGPRKTGVPRVVLHPFGHTWTGVAAVEAWASAVKKMGHRAEFTQVGVATQARIPGVQKEFLTVPEKPFSRWEARKLFALIRASDLLIGVNSGPMHVARAFEKPALILIHEGEPEEIFRNRREAPYFQRRNHAKAFLYEKNAHLNVAMLSAHEVSDRIVEWVTSQSRTLS